jgi:ADP-heptose:LPS heptosyltransferase
MAQNAIKSLEISLKNKFSLFLRKKKNTILIAQPDDIFNDDELFSILLLRQDRIGDLLVSVPTIKELRNTLPNTRIDIILGSKNISARKAIEPYIDNIYLYDKKLLSSISMLMKIRNQEYALVIDMFDNASSTSSYLTNWSNAALALGIEKSNRDCYNYIVPLKDKNTTHITERIAQLLLPFGIEPTSLDLRLEYPISREEKNAARSLLPIDADKQVLGIILSGSSPEKFWGQENLTRFLISCKQHFPQLSPVLFYQNDKAETARAIASQSGAAIATPAKDFHEFAAAVSLCDYLLTPDTSAVHLASAFKIPCVALYTYSGNQFGMPWYPYKTTYKALVTECSDGIKMISPDEAAKALSEILK